MDTAKEFLEHYGVVEKYIDETASMERYRMNHEQAMIEFADFHVRKALKEANICAHSEVVYYIESYDCSGRNIPDLDNDSDIINAYPTTKII